MKKLMCLMTLALAVFGLRAVADQAPTEVLPLTVFKNLRAGKKQTVVVYGTSLTVGGAWAKVLKEYLEKHFPGQVTFLNSGGSGQNSDWGVANLQNKVLAHRPDLIFIEFSYNDAHMKFDLSVEKAARNLDTMIQALRAQNGQLDIVLQTMNVPWNAPNGNGSATARPQINDYNEVYRRYAREHTLPLLDHFVNWSKLLQDDPKKYQSWVPDGSHPNAESSRAVTWPAIEALLDKARLKVAQ